MKNIIFSGSKKDHNWTVSFTCPQCLKKTESLTSSGSDDGLVILLVCGACNYSSQIRNENNPILLQEVKDQRRVTEYKKELISRGL